MHLRVLFVSQVAYFMNMPLFENLTFGLSKVREKDRDRVRAIMMMLGMPRVVKLMDHQLQDQEHQDGHLKWIDALTSSERAKLHLARAFVMNPEVMLAQRQLANFNTHEASNVLMCYAEHVKCKGLTRAYRMPDLVVSQACRRRRACRCRRACRRRRFVLLLSPTPRPLFNTLRAQCSGGAEVCCTIYIYIYIYGVRAHQRPKETTPVLSEQENGTANVKVLQMAVR